MGATRQAFPHPKWKLAHSRKRFYLMHFQRLPKVTGQSSAANLFTRKTSWLKSQTTGESSPPSRQNLDQLYRKSYLLKIIAIQDVCVCSVCFVRPSVSTAITN